MKTLLVFAQIAFVFSFSACSKKSDFPATEAGAKAML